MEEKKRKVVRAEKSPKNPHKANVIDVIQG